MQLNSYVECIWKTDRVHIPQCKSNFHHDNWLLEIPNIGREKSIDYPRKHFLQIKK